jgi:hypothetical protein
MNRRAVVLVVGSHRSGTSAVAGSLARAGLAFGDELLEANEGNQLGYFEDREFVSLNDALLARFGLNWHDPRLLPDGWQASGEAAAARAAIGELLRARLSRFPVFGLKDPRLCVLLPLYLELLAEQDVACGCVLVYRHPTESALSLAQRDGFPAAKASLLWLRDNLAAERATRAVRRGLVRFETVMERPLDVLSELFGRIGFEPVPDWQVHVRAGLREHLRRQRCSDAPGHPWVAGTFASLGALERGEDLTAGVQLDETMAALRLAAPLFESVLQDLSSRLETANLALRLEQGASLESLHEKILTGLRGPHASEVSMLQAELGKREA